MATLIPKAKLAKSPLQSSTIKTTYGAPTDLAAEKQAEQAIQSKQSGPAFYASGQGSIPKANTNVQNLYSNLAAMYGNGTTSVNSPSPGSVAYPTPTLGTPPPPQQVTIPKYTPPTGTTSGTPTYSLLNTAKSYSDAPPVTDVSPAPGTGTTNPPPGGTKVETPGSTGDVTTAPPETEKDVGTPPTNGPVIPAMPKTFNKAAYDKMATEYAAQNKQISPYEWVNVLGGALKDYPNLYQTGNWYDINGNLTANAPAGVSAAPSLNPDQVKQLNTLYPQNTPNISAPTLSIPKAGTAGNAATTGYQQGQFTETQAPSFYTQDYMKAIEDSPTYQWQKQELLSSLDKQLAAKGLSNSGAALELKQKSLNQLAATEADKARQEAENAANRSATWGLQQNANNVKVYLENESNRLASQIKDAEEKNDFVTAERLREQQGQIQNAQNQLTASIANQATQKEGSQFNATQLADMLKTGTGFQQIAATEGWDRIMDILNAGLNQTPMPESYGLTSTQANLYGSAGTALSNIMGQIAGTYGGIPAGTTAPPLPSQPDYSSVNALNAANFGIPSFWQTIFGGA